jgi:hypothetical protein
MNLYVDSNLALELPSDVTPQSPAQKKKSDPRAELASQFVPSGARVLDLSEIRRCSHYCRGTAITAGSAASARNAPRWSAI